MKRTLSSIAAAALVLGSIAPEAYGTVYAPTHRRRERGFIVPGHTTSRQTFEKVAGGRHHSRKSGRKR